MVSELSEDRVLIWRTQSINYLQAGVDLKCSLNLYTTVAC